MSITLNKTILREGLGFSQKIPFKEFAELIIQEPDVARAIATELIDGWDGEYTDNEDHPEYIERYTVLNREELSLQIEEYFS